MKTDKKRSVKELSFRNLFLLIMIFFLGLTVAAVVVGFIEAVYQRNENAYVDMAIFLTNVDNDELSRIYTEAKERYERGQETADEEASDVEEDEAFTEIRGRLQLSCIIPSYKDVSFVFFDEEKDRVVYVVNGDPVNVRSPGEWQSCAAPGAPSISRMKKLERSLFHLDIRCDAGTGLKLYYYCPILLGKLKDQGVFVFEMTPYDFTRDIAILLIFSIPMFLILILIIAFLMSRILRRYLIEPIVGISDATERFVHLDSEELMKGSRAFAGLEAGSDDPAEVVALTSDMKMIEERVAGAINEIRSMTEERERIAAELEFASKIQQAMLPALTKDYTEGNGFSLYALMRPESHVGGDFYDFFLIDDDHLAFLVADVSDKGMGAALFMAISKSVIRTRAFSGGSPSEVLRNADDILSAGNKEDMFVTVLLGILDLNTGEVTACNGGHDYPMICTAGEKGEGEYSLRKEEHGGPLAFLPETQYPELKWKLRPGDRIFLYTDGVNESMVEGGVQFGTERMLGVLNEHRKDDDQGICESMLAAVDEYMGGAQQFDDITMLSVTYKGRK